MVQIIPTRGESPRRIELGGIIMETGYFRSHYEATVERGDTLEGIAHQLGTTPHELYAQNKSVFGDDPKIIELKEGQKLIYKTKPHRGVEICI